MDRAPALGEADVVHAGRGPELRAEGHEVFPFTNGNAALEAIEPVAPELVITDLYFDKTKAQGLDILHKARSLNPPAVDRWARRPSRLAEVASPARRTVACTSSTA